VKRILFVKTPAVINLNIIITLLITNIGLSDFYNTYQNENDHRIAWFNDQTGNILTETTGIKVQLKPIQLSFADKFFAAEYYKDRLSKHPKVFTIISETLSEINLRNSSFLIAELSTST
jgi:hypothetical protein